MDDYKIIKYNWLLNFGILIFDENYKSITSETKKLLWLPDSLSQNCFSCETKFSLLFDRRHHCRICGNIFCGNCTNKQIQFSVKDKNRNDKVVKIKVCDYCFRISVNFDFYIKRIFIKDINLFEYFCKYIDISNKENEKFLGIGDLCSENEIKKNLINSYDVIIQNMVKSVLKEYFEDNIVTEWKNVVYNIIIKVINNLRNSYLFLNDSLDVNKYIKIKFNDYKDNSLSEVIPGLVIKMNQNKKFENIQIFKPKILLINLENNLLLQKMNNFSNSFQRNNGFIQIIFKKINIFNPDIIIMGKNYAKLFQNELNNQSSMKNKYIFYDIKKKHLEEIARTTCNIIIPSFNLIGKNNPYGKCRKFYIKNMKSNTFLVFEGYSPILFNSIILSGNNNFFLKKMKMILKNILIPSARDLYFQKYLIYAFNMKINKIIESSHIFQILENNKKYRPKQIKEKKMYTTFEMISNKYDAILNITNKLSKKRKKINKSSDKKENILKNLYRQNSLYYNNKNENINIVNSNSNNQKLNDINECYYNGFDLSLICKKREYINYSLLKIFKVIDENKINNNSITINNNKNQIIIDENAEDNNFLDEKEIQKKYKKYKNNLKKIFFSFFSDNKFHDKSVFQYFYEFFENGKNNCKICGETINKHLYQFYKVDAKISIKYITDKEYNLDKIKAYLDKGGYFNSDNLTILFNIYTYGYCNICNNIVTPLIRLNNEILNYSMAKLLKFFFENINMQNINREYEYNIKKMTGNNNMCKHLINKNISRIFISELGSCVFDYSNIIKYYIDPMNINIELESNSNIDINNNLNLNNDTYNLYNNDNFILIEQLSTEAFINSKTALDIIKELFNSQINSLKNLINKEKLYLFDNNITNLINIAVMALRLVDNFKNNIFKYMTKKYIQDNDKDLYIMKYIIIIKKIYLKIIQIKSLSNTISKILNQLNIISDILYSKIPYSYEENIKLQNKNETPIEMQKLENKKEYLNIISFIDYYDNRHNKFDTEIIKDDISNIISNTLASDDYINFIDNIDNEDDIENIKFSEICCKRINNINFNADEIKKHICNQKNNMLYLDINDLLENSVLSLNIKEELNNDNSKNEKRRLKTYNNSSLLFNLEKNKFYLNKSSETNSKSFKQTEDDENKKIIEYLKQQLLSEDKKEFNYSLTNNFSGLLKNYYIKKDISSLSIEKSFEKNTNDNFNNYFKDDEEDEEKDDSEENQINTKTMNLNETIMDDINKLNEEMTYIKNQLIDLNKAFIENQRQLNLLIRDSITEQKQNNLKRDSSSRSLFKVFNRSRKNSTSSKGSNDSNGSKHSRKSSEVEYKEYGSKSFKLDSNSLSKLNDMSDNNNIIDKSDLPKFSYMPEFLKIFELKKIISLEDKIISKKYPEYEIKIFYPKQFQALRTLYFSENFENFIFSLKQSEDWEISGGKSKANFFRTLDEKFALKNISELEFNMLIDSGLNYFKHLSKYFFDKKPCLLAKILGAFHVKVKVPKEKEKNYYLIYMENIYYNILSRNNFNNFNTPESNLKVYDLKGSKINRYITPKNKKKGKILLDTNFLEDTDGEPLFFDFDNYKILKNALINDCNFLKKEEIIDYSLLIIFEISDKKEKNELEIKKIRMGIIDYLRKYTWDKQIESYGKKIIHGFSKPTIINPEKYSERFIKKFKKYFACV